jgi:hypothetical protein
VYGGIPASRRSHSLHAEEDGEENAQQVFQHATLGFLLPGFLAADA